MYEQQERLGENERKIRMEQPESVMIMTKGSSPRMDQMSEKMPSDMWDDYGKHTNR